METHPRHPGEWIRKDCLEPNGLTVTRAARGLGVTRKTLSELLNGRSGVSPEMALRLSQAFGGTPQRWLQMQADYDLWHIRMSSNDLRIECFNKKPVWK